jgi:hypothetical protein
MILIDSMIEAVLGEGLDKFYKNIENQIKFKNDTKRFLNAILRDVSLDIFLFAERPEVKVETEFFDLENIYVPITFSSNVDLRIFPTKTEQEVQKNTANTDHFHSVWKDKNNIVKYLELMDRNPLFYNTMLIGNAGSGKSVFLKYLTKLFASETAQKIKFPSLGKDKKLIDYYQNIRYQYIPVLIRLRDIEIELEKFNSKNWVENFTFEDFFKLKYNITYETQDYYTRLFQHFPCLFLLDGVDEVPEHKAINEFVYSRAEVKKWIFHQNNAIPKDKKSRFILTSRQTETNAFRKEFSILYVEPFSPYEIQLFINYWYNEYARVLENQIDIESKKTRKQTLIKKFDNLDTNKKIIEERVADIAFSNLVNNPLILSLSLLIHSIDNSINIADTEKMYESYIRTFLYKWDDVREMNFYADLFGDRSYERLFDILHRLAFHFSQKGVAKLKVSAFFDNIILSITRFKSKYNKNQIRSSATTLLENIRDRSGVLTCHDVADDFLESVFEFQHLSFQEYLTAVSLHKDALVQNKNFPLIEKMNEEFWNKIIDFYVNTGNPDYFLFECLNNLENKIRKKNIVFFIRYTHLLDIARDIDPSLYLRTSTIIAQSIKKSQNVKEVLIYSICTKCLKQITISDFDKIYNENDLTYLGLVKSCLCAHVIAHSGYYDDIKDHLLIKLEKGVTSERKRNFIEYILLLPLSFIFRDINLIKIELQFIFQRNKLYIYSLLSCISYLYKKDDFTRSNEFGNTFFKNISRYSNYFPSLEGLESFFSIPFYFMNKSILRRDDATLDSIYQLFTFHVNQEVYYNTDTRDLDTLLTYCKENAEVHITDKVIDKLIEETKNFLMEINK